MEMKIKKSNLNWWTFFVNGLIALVYGLFALLLPAQTVGVVVTWTGIVVVLVGLVCLLVSFKRKKAELPFKLLMFNAVLMMIVGFVAALWPKQTMSFVVFIIGLWAVIIGAMLLFTLFSIKDIAGRGFYIMSGILSLAFGILLIVNPFESAKVFVVITGIVALIFSIIMMMFSFNLRRLEKELQKETIDIRSEEV
jgi:Uncharacterized conserved protein